MKWILYCTTCIVNNKIYVGVHKTQDPEVFDGYIGCGVKVTVPSSYMNPTTPFQLAVKKYGTKNFKRSVLKIFDNEKDAYDYEATMVNREFINRKDVYNAHIGGIGGGILKKVYQFSLTGEFLKEWSAIIDASDFYGISHTSIKNAVKFKYSSKGYFWSFKSEINISEYKNNVKRKCYKYDGDSLKFLEEYNSIEEAAKYNNVIEATLRRGIDGGYKVNGFYYSDTIQDLFELIPKISLKNKTIYVYTLNGDFICELHSGKEICDFFKTKTTHPITTAMRAKKPYKDYQMFLEKYDRVDPIESKRNVAKKIGRYSMTGELLETFDSATQAIKIYGTGVNRVLKGQQSHCKNFIFRKL